jgi:hypothetical protein
MRLHTSIDKLLNMLVSASTITTQRQSWLLWVVAAGCSCSAATHRAAAPALRLTAGSP